MSSRAPSHASSEAADPSPRRQALPHPDKLAGSVDIDSWFVSMRAKLRVDGEALGDGYARFHYVYSRLGAKPRALLLPYVKRAELTPLEAAPTALAFLDHIRSIYEEPNHVLRAGQRLTRTRQGASEPIGAYIPRWEQILYEAAGDSWPADAKIVLFASSLNTTTKDRLDRSIAWPTDYVAFMAHVRGQESIFLGDSTPGRSRSTTSATEYVDDPMQIDATRVVIATTATNAQKRRWRTEGRCMKCGSSDHWASKCPSSVKSKIRSTRTVHLLVPGEDEASGSETA